MSKNKQAAPAPVTRETPLAGLLTGVGYDADSTARSLDLAGYRTVGDVLDRATWKGPLGRRVYDVLRAVAGVSTRAAIEIGDVVLEVMP